MITVAVVCLGCGWQKSVEFESGDRKQRVEIFQPPVDAMLGLRIDLVKDGMRTTLLKEGETYFGFAHVVWPDQGSTVGILLCGTRQVRMAYDLTAMSQRPFVEVRDKLNASAVNLYGVDPDKTAPTDCFGTYYQEQFQRKYPTLRH